MVRRPPGEFFAGRSPINFFQATYQGRKSAELKTLHHDTQKKQGGKVYGGTNDSLRLQAFLSEVFQ
jgi:hypothetical protein